MMMMIMMKIRANDMDYVRSIALEFACDGFWNFKVDTPSFVVRSLYHR